MSMRHAVLLALFTFSPCIALVSDVYAGHELSLRHSRSSGHHSPNNRDWTTWVGLDTNGKDATADVFKCWMGRARGRLSTLLTISCMSNESCALAAAWRNSPGSTHDFDISLRPVQTTDSLPEWPLPPRLMNAYYPTVVGIMTETGKGVLHTDLDAMWVGDVEGKLADIDAAFPHADLVFSQENGMGHTLCNGFVLYRNTPRTQRLLKELAESYSADDTDEETVMNNALKVERGCTWSGAQDVTGSEVTVGECGELTVVALARELVGRDQEITDDDKRIVIHPIGRTNDKFDILRDMKLCS